MTDRLGLRQFAPPALLLVAVGLYGSTTSAGTRDDFTSALIMATIVIALYVFVGNSGVISFGHISFVAIGAFAAGVMTIPSAVKPTVMPNLFPFLAENSIGSFESLILAAALGAFVAFFAGLALMRLSGLAAGIATFAVLEITHNVLRFWTKIGPGAQTLSLVPEDIEPIQAMLGALFAAAVAFAFQRSRSGRLLRASREDPAAAQAAGIDVHRKRMIAFTISGALAGLAGGLLVHQIGSITTEQVYLRLTFITLAMLVVGGMRSLWGAVVGALVVSFLDIVLIDAESGLGIGPATIDLPVGSSLVILGAVMAAMLILRPSGLTGGNEATLRVPKALLRRRDRADSGAGKTPKTGPASKT
ncbi:MAG TPA: branched-chain amino acid ABC transporter permease [Solirubrobacterales bacterium]|nr:branched-chain amino acid ABC transporter permease [Solirubrobacterales bacterium]